MDEVEGALEVHSDHCVPLSLRHTHHQAVFGDTGIVDQDVYASEVFMYLFDYLLGLSEVGGVGSVSFHLHAEGGNLLLGLLAVLVNYQVGEGDVGAFLCKAERYLLADAAGGAGDDSGFSFE